MLRAAAEESSFVATVWRDPIYIELLVINTSIATNIHIGTATATTATTINDIIISLIIVLYICFATLSNY